MKTEEAIMLGGTTHEAEKGYTPYGDRVLVVPAEKLTRTSGGIFIPETVRQKPKTGIVWMVGEKTSFAKVGRQVLFSEETGIELTIDNKECLLMKESEILLQSDFEVTKLEASV